MGQSCRGRQCGVGLLVAVLFAYRGRCSLQPMTAHIGATRLCSELCTFVRVESNSGSGRMLRQLQQSGMEWGGVWSGVEWSGMLRVGVALSRSTVSSAVCVQHSTAQYSTVHRLSSVGAPCPAGSLLSPPLRLTSIDTCLHPHHAQAHTSPARRVDDWIIVVLCTFDCAERMHESSRRPGRATA